MDTAPTLSLNSCRQKGFLCKGCPVMKTSRIETLCTYPIKGFSPHFLEAVTLEVGGAFPHDRAYALKRGDWDFNQNDPGYHFKTKFYMLLRDQKIAELKTRYSLDDFSVEITEPGGNAHQFFLQNPVSLKEMEAFLIDFLKPPEALKIVTAPGHSMSDVAMKVASIINLASVQELADQIGQSVDPIRFRGNIYFSGNEPWQEFEWVGKSLQIGTTEFKVTKPIERCKATHVDPETGKRDLGVVPALHQHFGHYDMGIYAEVIKAGTTKIGNQIAVL